VLSHGWTGLCLRDHVGVGDPEIIAESETGSGVTVLFSLALRREPWPVPSVPCLVGIVSGDRWTDRVKERYSSL
jgi:hypothetical protein